MTGRTFTSWLLRKNRRNFRTYFLFFLYDLQIARRIRRSGLFGTGWYLASNPAYREYRRTSWWAGLARLSIPLFSKFARLMIHPVWHYVRTGEKAGSSPCIFFDARKYLACYPDVRESGMNAFWHYIRHGAEEGRKGFGRLELDIAGLGAIRSACLERLAIREISPEMLPEGKPGGSIAVHLHLFYPELKEQFVRALKNIPCKFDLFISCCSDGESAEEFRAALPNAGTVRLQKVPNRGRDLAPFLTTFADELRRYDIICHLHTKRSPHDPALKEWLDRILRLLLGSPEQTAGILTLLRQDGKFVYPAAHPKAEPDSITGWSCNYDAAKQLLDSCTDLDIRQFPIIDFPHGSMFWARSEALKRLLELPLSPDDFPAEPIPPDGTVAHALERLLLVLASDVPGKAYRLTADR
ncbi:MAG: hypothetical protein HPZ91_12440 [Lentisphaeria bacterium]|nr:hypothetical protein [Lentisphaeria bacterium]